MQGPVGFSVASAVGAVARSMKRLGILSKSGKSYPHTPLGSALRGPSGSAKKATTALDVTSRNRSGASATPSTPTKAAAP